MPSYALQTRDLSFAHDDELSWEFDDIALAAGDHLLILGKSGSGKTTLLHLLSGLLQAKSGQIIVDGQDLNTMKQVEVDDLRGSKIGMVFQRPHFIRSLSVIENIRIATSLGKNEPLQSDEITDILDQLNIQQLVNKKTYALSEGEKQRVAIARALANKPAILLADEPTSALDHENCEAVIKLLVDSSRLSNCALIVVTHDDRVKQYFSNQMIID